MTAKHAGPAQIMSDIIVRLKHLCDDCLRECVLRSIRVSERLPLALFRGTKDNFA